MNHTRIAYFMNRYILRKQGHSVLHVVASDFKVINETKKSQTEVGGISACQLDLLSVRISQQSLIFFIREELFFKSYPYLWHMYCHLALLKVLRRIPTRVISLSNNQLLMHYVTSLRMKKLPCEH